MPLKLVYLIVLISGMKYFFKPIIDNIVMNFTRYWNTLFYIAYAANVSVEKFWIGLNDIETENTIEWIDDTTLYPNDK